MTEGVLRVDKREGPTSHDAVRVARRALGTRRVGHTGTLDPFATGLLLICVGRATRIAEYLSGLPKTYLAEARLGEATDTLDRTGAVLASDDAWRGVDEAALRAALESLRGEQMQVPPAYSAKKVEGERAYARARRGEEVEVEPVPVTVHSIELLGWAPPLVRFRVTVSSGTYVRALARDLGERLGTGAHLTALRREAVGAHSVAGAVGLDRLEAGEVPVSAWLTPLEALGHLPVVELDEAGVREVGHGRPVPLTAEANPGAARAEAGLDDAPTIVLAHGGELIAIGERDGDVIRPRKVFA